MICETQNRQSVQHIQKPACCTLPESSNASDLLGSFVSLNDYTWLKLGICIFLAGQSMVWGLAVNTSEIPPFSIPYWGLHVILLASAIVVLSISGYDLLRTSILHLLRFRLGIESLFMISLLGSLCGSVYSTFTGAGDIYYEVVIVVIVIYSFGRKVGQISKDKALIEANKFREQFSYVSILKSSGEEADVPYDDLTNGTLFLVRPGQPICADGVITSGYGFVKETPLTGEPHPILKKEGDTLHAGTFSIDGTFQAEFNEANSERMIDHILKRVESSIEATKSYRQEQADRWIHHFVIFVCLMALITGVSWSIIDTPSTGWINSMSVLLIACPCALGLATPLAIWTGLWQLSRYGIVSRASHLMDSLAHTKHIFFDKTGTLTESTLTVGKILPKPGTAWNADQIYSICKKLEENIDHPIARAFQSENPNYNLINEPKIQITNQRWEPGEGVTGRIKDETGRNKKISLGTRHSLKEGKNQVPQLTKIITLSLNNKTIATIELQESIREGVRSLFRKLNQNNIRCSILTGDPNPQWKQIENVSVRAGLNPIEKAELIKLSIERKEYPIYVGDGINDLDAMASSLASISIHDGGASLTQSSSNAILIGKSLSPIYSAIQLAKHVDQTLKTNLIIAVCYNLIGISLAATGILHPVASALIMITSSLLVTFRAIRKAESYRIG